MLEILAKCNKLVVESLSIPSAILKVCDDSLNSFKIN